MKTFFISTLILFLSLPIISQSFTRGPFTSKPISLPVVADFNGDDKPDITSVARFFSAEGDLQVHINASEPDSIIFETMDLGLRVFGNPGTGDFDGDGDMDIVVIESVNSQIVILLNSGDESFETKVQSSEIAFNFLTSDMDGDGDIDIVSLARDDNKAYLMLNDGTGEFTTTQLISEDELFTFEIGDIDGDNDVDVIFGFDNFFDRKIILLENQGDATFVESIITDSGQGSLENLQMVDLNKDGFNDVIYSSRSSSTLRALLRQSDGSYIEQELPLGAGSIRSFDIADYNTDGIMDVMIGCNSSDNTFHKGTSSSLLEYETEIITSIQPMFYIVNGDFDSDNDLDVIVSNGDFWWLINELEQEFVSVDDLDESQYLIYPNPFSKHLQLDIPLGFEFFISDMQGRRLYHSDGANMPLNLEFLEEGSYLISIMNKKSGEVVQTSKIIKVQ